MLDANGKTGDAALLVRPIPWSMATGTEPIRFGGKPRLPEGMTWPVGPRGIKEHFFAEIDLARLPRKTQCQRVAPDMPAAGTIFIFLPLGHDWLYGHEKATVLFTEQDVSDLPERAPPDDLPNMHDGDPPFLHADGTTDGGRLLVPQLAEAIPFPAQHALNPLHRQGADEAVWERACKSNTKHVREAFRAARPMPPDPAVAEPEKPKPDWANAVRDRVPKAFRKFRFQFEGHHLDWEFIFDWAHTFQKACLEMAISYLEEMLEQGGPSARIKRHIRRLEKKWEEHCSRAYLRGKQPKFWTFDKPVAVNEHFDWQARRWMTLSQFEEGYPEPRHLDAFIAMLTALERHCHESGSAALRIGLMDNRIRGHVLGAEELWDEADLAFKEASDHAAKRHFVENVHIPKVIRWDSRVIAAINAVKREPDTSGVMPHQMFGMGFEIQSTVTEHHDDILLFQVGNPYGLPLETGPDMVVQLWIKPEDLAAGRFDRVQRTMDMS